MTDSSFIERLEESHEFPGPFTLKAIGPHQDGFVASILAAVQGELQLPDVPEHSLRQTPNGRHVSVTVELIVESAPDVARLYARLRCMEEIRFLI